MEFPTEERNMIHTRVSTGTPESSVAIMTILLSMLLLTGCAEEDPVTKDVSSAQEVIHNLGLIKLDSDTLRTSLAIRNSTEKSRLIQHVTYSCGCSKGVLNSDTIKAFDSTSLFVSIGLRSFDTLVNKSFSVVYEGGLVERHFVKAAIQRDLAMEPRSGVLIVPEGVIGTKTKMEFSIQNRSDKNITIDSIVSKDANVRVSKCPKMIPSFSRATCTLNCRIVKDNMQFASVYVYADSSAYRLEVVIQSQVNRKAPRSR